ncbi:type II secretion system F family protein [Microbacteriaceae bacterium K1510]|nr:type II secretion system F family protein [Microbacteriaceae bacterium K1510]
MLLFALTMMMLFFVSGGALIGALVISRRKRLTLEHRVTLAAATAGTAPTRRDLLLQTRTPQFDARLRRVFVGNRPIWGMKTGGLALLVMAAVAAAIVLLITYAGFHWPLWLVIPLALAAAFALPRVVLLRQQKAADRQFTDLFPDAVVAIARMLRAGLPITTAVHSVSHEAPAPVNSVFATISNQIDIGTPIEDALDVSGRQIGLADFRFFTMAIVMQHLTGGNLAATLEVLADIIRRRRAVRLKAQATTAEIRVSAYVLASLPLLIVGTLLLIQPGYLAPLINDPRGHIIMVMAAGGLLLGGLTMRQMMRSVTQL